jgi:hypothetical protein
MSWLELVPVILIGGTIGAIVLSLLTFTAHWLLLPPAIFGDGQYAMVFMWTLPAGAFLGAITGVAMHASFADQYSKAGWICLGGALPLLLCVVLLSAFFALGQEAGFKEFCGFLLFWFGTSVIWAGALVLRGILFLRMPVA